MAGVLSSVRRIYLTIYNWIVFFGWLQVFYLTVKTLRESGHQSVYAAVEKPLVLAQSAALLEILHSLTGIVRSPITTTLPQISSRIYLTWGILQSFPEIRTHFFVSSMVISWSITEIIRYSFFGSKEAFGFTPSWLLWLRYSTFIVLYPTGITSEVGIIYNCLPYLKETGKFSIRMPNKFNFGFDYYYNALVVLGTYVPGIPHLYGYMLAQRKKALPNPKLPNSCLLDFIFNLLFTVLLQTNLFFFVIELASGYFGVLLPILIMNFGILIYLKFLVSHPLRFHKDNLN